MRPTEWVRCDKPWALMIHQWGIIDRDARVQADDPWLCFETGRPYCITVFHEKVCRCGLFELLSLGESPKLATRPP